VLTLLLVRGLSQRHWDNGLLLFLVAFGDTQVYSTL